MLFAVIVSIGLLIIAGLGVYAGRLLYLLSQQNKRNEQARAKRLETLLESIETIAFAMQQQQCNISEGAIRLCHLLDALPQATENDYRATYPQLHGLFIEVSAFATHEKRKALSKRQRHQEDIAREEIETQYENKVLQEIPHLIEYCRTLKAS
jgi:hypothetical protein